MTIDSAVSLADRGFKLIRLHGVVNSGCTCRDPKCEHIGKHPRIKNWQQKASSDRAQLEKWFKDSDSNVGVVTGQVSGIFVLDCDGEIGSASLLALEQKYTPLPETLTAITGRGKHFYFRHPGIPIKNSAGKLARGIDVRGDFGYVVAPPSHHANGSVYSWADASAKVSAAPLWLLEALTVEVEDVPLSEKILEGTRNDRLFAIVCVLFKENPPEDVLRLALAVNAERCEPPLADEEVQGIVARVALKHRPHPLAKSAGTKGASLGWFKFDAPEFLSNQNIRRLTDSQLAWRMRLIPHAWLQSGRLVNDLETLADFAKTRPNKKFREELPIALFDFGESDGYLVCRAMELEHAEKVAVYAVKKNAGSKGGSAKSHGKPEGLKEAA